MSPMSLSHEAHISNRHGLEPSPGSYYFFFSFWPCSLTEMVVWFPWGRLIRKASLSCSGAPAGLWLGLFLSPRTHGLPFSGSCLDATCPLFAWSGGICHLLPDSSSLACSSSRRAWAISSLVMPFRIFLTLSILPFLSSLDFGGSPSGRLQTDL